MSSSMTVITKWAGGRKAEYKAAGGITPGHLLQISSAGAVVHAVAGGNCYPLFAIENDLVGNDINDAYTSGQQIQAVWAGKGTQLNALIADGENIAIGDLLESNGAGRLRKHVLDSTGIYYTKNIIAVAEEACDMSGSAGVDPSGRCLVTII